MLSRFHEVEVKHVRREQNSEADRLVNEAIDAAGHRADRDIVLQITHAVGNDYPLSGRFAWRRSLS